MSQGGEALAEVCVGEGVAVLWTGVDVVGDVRQGAVVVGHPADLRGIPTVPWASL
ncbi:hypothetical protein ACFWIV_10040 [Streptomyces virginiae]|uniref:hypothetical protein n=1 Tax=Streptomyces virginiae TaxID=1961 RepID=UPI0036683088